MVEEMVIKVVKVLEFLELGFLLQMFWYEPWILERNGGKKRVSCR